MSRSAEKLGGWLLYIRGCGTARDYWKECTLTVAEKDLVLAQRHVNAYEGEK